MDKQILDYIDSQMPRFIDEWGSLIRIKSISPDPQHKADMLACAERWKTLLLQAGVQEVKIHPTEGNPIVVGHYYCQKKTEKPSTVLVYGHYDVMPVEPLEEWKTEPFEPVIKDGRLYARGADDDKGQTMIQVKAFEYLCKKGLLKHNVTFIFEGEEEIGSPNLTKFLTTHKDELKSDIILVSDTSMLGRELPSLTVGLRGLAYWQIRVSGPNRDLHSGHFGGAVANPINVLCELIARMKDKDGRITIPHFYDDVLPIPQEEREMIKSIPFDEKQYCENIGITETEGEVGYSTLERNYCRPSFDVCGIWGGYMGEGSKTVIPREAFAKVSCRLVPNQDHEKISQAFIDYVREIAPESIRVEITPMHGGEGYVCPIDLPQYKAAEKAFEEAFRKRPIAARRGGSIPIIADFERILGVKTILMGFGLEQNAIHSPNESFLLEVFKKGIYAVIRFHEYISKD